MPSLNENKGQPETTDTADVPPLNEHNAQPAPDNTAGVPPPTVNDGQPEPPETADARTHTAGAGQRLYWRSLEEFASADEFRAFLQREFPRQASAWSPALDRRGFLTLLGASLALAGLSGCASKQPDERIVPYVDPSDAIVPGEPLFFATAVPIGGVATGALVTSREGRPVKIEGNPDHPASLGATDAIMQATLLDLYDPDRAQSILRLGIPDSWNGILGELDTARRSWDANLGLGLRILTETVTSPTLAAQIGDLRSRYPFATWHQYEPLHRDNVRSGARAALGSDANTIYDFAQAEVILSLDGDFLLTMPGHVRYARDFSDRRRVLVGETGLHARPDSMNRLYVAESMPTITGAIADHRVALRPSEIEALAYSLAARIGGSASGGRVSGDSPSGGTLPGGALSGGHPALSPALEAWIDAAARDLQQRPGTGLVVAGDTLPAHVHALVHSINAKLDAVGKTVLYTEPIEAEPSDHTSSLAGLVRAMNAHQVDALMIVGGNPVYFAPADLDFARALSNVPLSVHLATHEDETSALCRWHVPEQHYLEAWSDARAYDGTTSILQPVITPLYSDSRSAHEMLDAIIAPPGRSGHDIVKDFWRKKHVAVDFETYWRTVLHDGLVPGSAAAAAGATARTSPAPAGAVMATAPGGPTPGTSGAMTATPSVGPATGASGPVAATAPGGTTPGASAAVTPKGPGRAPTGMSGGVTAAPPGGRTTAEPGSGTSTEPGAATPSAARSVAVVPPGAEDGTLDILFRPDPNIRDGRYANNGWLQEMPRPLSKLTWDNAALISPRTARALNVANEDVVDLEYRGRTVRAPIWILPGHADNCVSVPLGFGRSRCGGVGVGVGFNAYALRTSDAPWNGAGLRLTRTPDLHRLASTHTHHTMEGRDLIRVGSIDTFRKDRNFAHSPEHAADNPPMLLPESPREGYAWGMAIDNNVCIGCNACVSACQAENNIPVVGKEEVLRGREMHWLRIDRYYSGRDLEAPRGTYFMPVPCMHCEKAPCELVCPVGATVHDKDGLNEMVYNRCVGTRYCSNNCPYKVRRFNFFQYSNELPVLQLMRNPEVTVRTRGVMEKCTYCIQRIQTAKIQAEKQDRTVGDGEVKTACQQACPTNAIIFGDINDPASTVSRLKAQPHNYSLLSELNTRPRTTYLAKLENPNAELEGRNVG